jgi:hypothetical protein
MPLEERDDAGEIAVFVDVPMAIVKERSLTAIISPQPQQRSRKPSNAMAYWRGAWRFAVETGLAPRQRSQSWGIQHRRNSFALP